MHDAYGYERHGDWKRNLEERLPKVSVDDGKRHFANEASLQVRQAS